MVAIKATIIPQMIEKTVSFFLYKLQLVKKNAFNKMKIAFVLVIFK